MKDVRARNGKEGRERDDGCKDQNGCDYIEQFVGVFGCEEFFAEQFAHVKNLLHQAKGTALRANASLYARAEFAFEPDQHDGVDAQIGHDDGNAHTERDIGVFKKLDDVCFHSCALSVYFGNDNVDAT